MSSAKYRHSITFERRSSSQDAIGQQLDTWEVIGQDKAEIVPITGREFFARSGEQADVTTKIRVRFHPSLLGIRADDRIAYGGSYFNIISPLNEGTLNREMVFMCSTFKP